MRILPRASLAALLTILAAGCGGSSDPAGAGGNGTATPPAAAGGANVSLDKNAYPAFPDPDSGADPSVPAEQGGRGFKGGEGWETNTDYDLIGDPRAVKGGVLRLPMMTDFPSTLRYYGPNVTGLEPDAPRAGVRDACSACIQPRWTTFRHSPLTGRFRQTRRRSVFVSIPTPGSPTGRRSHREDVVASWKLVVDKTLQDPARTLVYLELRASRSPKASTSCR